MSQQIVVDFPKMERGNRDAQLAQMARYHDHLPDFCLTKETDMTGIRKVWKRKGTRRRKVGDES